MSSRQLEVVPQNKTSFSLTPKTLDEAIKYADLIAKSDFCPREHKGKPGNILIAVQYGAELGLSPMQALQNISIINGRPVIWGDAMLALVMADKSFLDIHEDVTSGVATCIVERKGMADPVTKTFSIEDAKKANLWGKQGPWTQYPNRMLQMRARTFALRDAFPDVLKGLTTKEEALDYDFADPNTRSTHRINNNKIKVTVIPDEPKEEIKEDGEPVDWQFLIGAALNVDDLKKIYIDLKARKNFMQPDEYKYLIALIESTKLTLLKPSAEENNETL